MDSERYYIEKELSWLSFNERVLQEAMDKRVPLIERVRFLGIFSNNQDEFFKVRVSDVKRRILINQEQGGDENAKKLLSNIQKKVLKLQKEFDSTYKLLLKDLAKHNIFLIEENQLGDFHKGWLKNFFKEEILCHLTPIVMDDHTNLVEFLKDEYTYLAIEIKKGKKSKYSLIEIPTEKLPRFVQLPPEETKRKKTLIMLDNIIRFCMEDIFKGFYDFDALNVFSIKMTRDAEYDLRDQVDQSLLEQMSSSLKQRLTAEPVRFIYDREMPDHMVEYFKKKMRISSYDSIIPGGRYHNFKDFMGFPNVGRNYLEHTPLPPLNLNIFEQFETAFDAISHKDILLYYPYHSFRHITELIRQASFDPKVTSIKLNIYRVAKKSHIINSIIDAANNGKKVTVVVELQARFDEAANIKWAKRLTEAGVKVEFGIPSLKIHSKLCLITRREKGKLARYAHIGTGNFHEKTAKIYTDFALLTKHDEITKEVENVFALIEHPYLRFKFKHLIVSPIDSRDHIYSLIDREIKNADDGLPASITVKINNLVDQGVIEKLYEAGRAGVKIKMIIRGMCSLVPGVSGVSENISVISIVDRFLEHPRVAVFYNNGDEQIYISSADWMTRNIDRRIEVGCPIYDPELKQRIKEILNIQFKDTTKARIIDKNQKNEYKPRGNRKKIRSQVEIYDYLKNVETEEEKKKSKHSTKNSL